MSDARSEQKCSVPAKYGYAACNKATEPGRTICVGHRKRKSRGITGPHFYKPFKQRAPLTSGSEPISERIAHDREISGLKNELSLLKQKYLASLKESNAQEKILEFNRLAVKALPTVEPPKPSEKRQHESIESAVLVGSCWHIGETINKQEMGGLNEYDFDMFVRRLQFVIERAISFTTENMRTHSFEEMRVLLTGDMVSGIIHDELEETNQLNIIEQAHLGALVTAQAFLDLARVFPRVIATCVVGNHGRVKQKKYYKHKQSVNWDFVFYQTLALMLQNQRNIEFQIPMSFWAGTEIQGHKFLVMHGDLVRSWGGIPFYGLNREVSKWIEIKAAQGEFFRYFVASHFHTKAILQSAMGERILNASLKGGDEFAAGIGLYGDPIQLLFGVHRRYGKTWELGINAKFADIKRPRYRYDRTKGIADQLNTLKQERTGAGASN